MPLAAGGLVLLLALRLRSPLVLCLGVAVLVSGLADRSLAGLDGVRDGPVAGVVTLVADPVAAASGMRADGAFRGRRVELRAAGSAAEALAPRLAGEQVQVRGELTPVGPGAPWLTVRHIGAVLRAHVIEPRSPGGPAARAANGARRTLERGARVRGAEPRALYTGVVIGDDRAQSAALADDFLGAGLTHLLAVSGQNVAFALTLIGPLLRRLRLWPRLGVTLVAIGLFALMTRFEPSVLRASAMAALATAATTTGSPLPRLRVLALAATGLLVVDPLLVRSVGFQLSTAAAAAIVVLAGPLATVLPGPMLIREPLAVTTAAQLGVAPVLLLTFGPLPVASLPANLLAVPAAGPLMMWGLTGGMVAGVVPDGVATAIHLPTRLLLGWLASVAQRAARLPLGELRGGQVLVVAAGLALALVARRSGRSPRLRTAGLGLVAGALVVAVLSAQAPPGLRTELGPGLVWWHRGATDVVVAGGAGGRSPVSARSALAGLRRAGVGTIELLVLADTSVAASTVAAIEDRHPVAGIVVMPGGRAVPARAPVVDATRPASTLLVGGLEVRITATADRLVVEARPRQHPEEARQAPR
jgi:competence protein ComEC